MHTIFDVLMSIRPGMPMPYANTLSLRPGKILAEPGEPLAAQPVWSRPAESTYRRRSHCRYERLQCTAEIRWRLCPNSPGRGKSPSKHYSWTPDLPLVAPYPSPAPWYR